MGQVHVSQHSSCRLTKILESLARLICSFFRIVQMDHVDVVNFHSCRSPKDLSRRKKLLGRAEPYFRVTPNTKVCSNHFKYGRPTDNDPHPSLYLKGYPGISVSSKSTNKYTRRMMTYSRVLVQRPCKPKSSSTATTY